MAAAQTVRTIGIKFDPKPTTDGTTKAKKGIESVGKAAKDNARTVGRESGKMRKSILGAFDGIRSKILNVFSVAAVTVFFAAATKAASDFELAMVRVTKVTGFNAAQTAELAKEIRGLSRVLPSTSTDLLSISAAAAQLGVKGVDNIVLFTDVISRLSSATDVVGAEGAKQLARVLNVTRENVSTIEALADSIVNLGNNFAATESEITRMTLEISKATGVFGVSSQAAAALGATLISLGVQPELAGTSVGKVFIALNEILSEGGKKADELALIMGRSATSIERDFRANAMGVFTEFIGNVDAAGEQGLALLANFGVEGARIAGSLLPLAKNMDDYARATELAASANGALRKESDAVNKTFDSQVKILRNDINALFIDMGTAILPDVLKAVQAISSGVRLLTENFEDLGSIASTAARTITEAFSDAALKRMANLGAQVFNVVDPGGADARSLSRLANDPNSPLNTNNAASRALEDADIRRQVELGARAAKANIERQIAVGMQTQGISAANAIASAFGMPGALGANLPGGQAFTGPVLPPEIERQLLAAQGGGTAEGDRIRAALAQLKQDDPASTSGGGGSSRRARRARPNRGQSDGDLRDLASGAFEMEAFSANLARIEEGMLGAFNPVIMKDAREEMELLHRVMMDKISTGQATIEEGFRFGLLESIREVGRASQQAFTMARAGFDILGDSISNGLTSMVDGTESVKDAFKNMAVSILKDLAAMIIRQSVFNALSGVTGNLLGVGQTASPTAIVSAVPVQSFASGRTQAGQGSSMQNLLGMRSGQRAAILENDEMVLRPQDLAGMRGTGGNMTNIVLNTSVSVDRSGQQQTETNGQGVDDEQIAAGLNGAIVAVINDMFVTPGAPLYQGG